MVSRKRRMYRSEFAQLPNEQRQAHLLVALRALAVLLGIRRDVRPQQRGIVRTQRAQ